MTRAQNIFPQGAPERDTKETVDNILLTSHWLEDRQKHFFKEFDLTPHQYQVLCIVREALPEPVNLHIIKEKLIDKQSDASRLVERLHTKGYIQRQPNPYDRRAVNLSLTSEGRELLGSIDLRIHQLEKLLSPLDELEIKQLNHLLEKVRSR